MFMHYRFLIPSLVLLFASVVSHAGIADKVVRNKVAGIDLIACPTDVEDVVTFRGSIPAGDSFAPRENVAIPTLVGEMLDQGTTKQDKYAIAHKLESVGAQLGFSVDGVMLEFHGKCLRKDLPLVLSLLAEQLRMPAFAPAEFEKVKKQITGDVQRALESTRFQSEQAFAETAFPPGHPNYSPPVKDFLSAVQLAKIEELRAFHSKYYGPAHATMVVVGDLDVPTLQKEVATAFDGWTGGQPLPKFDTAKRNLTAQKRDIVMPDKPNVTVIFGQPTGLKYTDPDTLPLRVGTVVFGTGFTGRLMANVRDREGLTYGIGAGVDKDTFADGTWRIFANFAPNLLDKGMASTNRQLEKWYNEGITAEELARAKSYIVGTFKVSMATTNGLANTLLNTVHRGYDLTWVDEFPNKVSALTLEEVNTAIKKHLAPDAMMLIKAGTIPAAKE
jgi:zinc protease